MDFGVSSGSHEDLITDSVKNACNSSTIQSHKEFISSRSYFFVNGFSLQEHGSHIYHLGVFLEDVQYLHLSMPKKSRNSVVTGEAGETGVKSRGERQLSVIKICRGNKQTNPLL
ncbi:hypothetical protein EVAR_52445_1 [Eumeta japonica]|uniref:Uncharacterized protein n=1 Tax=Eumeta variegata TaxID=151549 RepID=A0A4C1YNM5_EUMVA|nr:hypothetical protein EVAR_52445_1 [Eumeta japonica]